MAFKIGDRVKPIEQESIFSGGEVVGFLPLPGYFKVKFDVNPPMAFNMGENPTMVPEDWFELEEK